MRFLSTRTNIMQKLLDYFVFSKAVVFIWGLILSHGLAEYALVNLLIFYLEDHWTHKLSLREAVIIVNLRDGVSAIFVVIAIYISEAYTGRFKMIIFCVGAYVVGLWLLWFSSRPHSSFSLFYVAVVLIAIGGRDPPLYHFLEFQLSEKMKQRRQIILGENENKKERNEIPASIWRKTAWISGAAIAVLAFQNADWQKTFKVCASVMGGSFIFFLLGYKYYYHENTTVSPLTSIYRVFNAALSKRKLRYPSSADNYYWKNHRQNHWYPKKPDELRLLPRAPFPFRFLDKAAIIRNRAIESPERQEKKGKLCTVKEVREVKRLTPMVYLGFCFIAYSLVVASGDTYFVLQSSNLNKEIGSFKFRVSFLFAIKSLVGDAVIFCFRRFNLTKQHITIWRIGAGMFWAVLCCIAAWQVELHRLRLIKSIGVLLNPDVQEDYILPLSILVLIPQYFLLGLMQGLAESGLAEFFYNFVPESLRNFEQSFTEFLLSIGIFLSIPCVLIFGSWFKEDINTSRLDKYFLMLAILSFVFLCIYLICLYCSSRYKFMEKYLEDKEKDPVEEASHDAPVHVELGSVQESSMNK